MMKRTKVIIVIILVFLFGPLLAKTGIDTVNEIRLNKSLLFMRFLRICVFLFFTSVPRTFLQDIVIIMILSAIFVSIPKSTEKAI